MKKIIALFLIFFTTMPAMAFISYDNDEPDISIYAKEIELKSKLRDNFSAYDVTIENKSDMVVKIVDGSFDGCKNGGDAYMENRVNADLRLQKRVHQWQDWGIWTLGGAWALSFAIVPFEWAYIICCNKNVKKESLIYSQENIFNSDFYPGEKFTKKVLFPINKGFYLRLSVRDEDTGQIYTITKEKADISY